MGPITVHIQKPAIHPPCYTDETPVGYLIRLAEINQYSSFRWLITSIDQRPQSLQHNRLFQLLVREKWTGVTESNQYFSEVFSLNSSYFLATKLRYCPKCIEKYGYFKMQWQFRVSVICIEHRAWLHDVCAECKNPIGIKNSRITTCVCGADIRLVDIENVADEQMMMQRFLIGDALSINKDTVLLTKDNGLDFKERLDLLGFFSRWLRKRTVTRSGISIDLANMKTARDNMADVAEALFSGVSGYRNFLKQLYLIKVAGKKGSGELLTRFHRKFYKDFRQECLVAYRTELEKFINNYWEKPLTKRNRNFSKKTIDDHPWITFKQASSEYDIAKSELRHAIEARLIRSQKMRKEQRTFTAIYKPDLEARLYRLKDYISAKEARAILGLSKAQFSRLLEKDVFETAICPNANRGTSWKFSFDEIYNYQARFTDGLHQIEGEYWSLAQLLQYFGGSIDDTLLTILNAIEKKNLIIAAQKKNSTGLASMMFAKEDFLGWYECLKVGDSLLSIPATSKLLGINQEFTYQLVQKNILATTEKSNSATKWVSEQNRIDFNHQYVLLSKLSKSIQMNSRKLMNYLARREIYPIDHGWLVKLRQKVYLKDKLVGVQILTEFF